MIQRCAVRCGVQRKTTCKRVLVSAQKQRTPAIKGSAQLFRRHKCRVPRAVLPGQMQILRHGLKTLVNDVQTNRQLLCFRYFYDHRLRVYVGQFCFFMFAHKFVLGLCLSCRKYGLVALDHFCFQLAIFFLTDGAGSV